MNDKITQKIVPHLWFDREAREAASFYAGIFPESRIEGVTTLEGTPSGEVDLVTIELAGLRFMLLSGGPYFRFTPAISFLVACSGRSEAERIRSGFGEPGRVLMPFDAYDFSPYYGWIEDRYGLSWQIMHDPSAQPGGAEVRIVPTLMFTGEACGKARDAIGSYTRLFDGSKAEGIMTYGPGAAPDDPDSVRHADFTLAGTRFAAMDSAYTHGFTFNEAVSLMVYCDDQAEIDRYWEALSADPAAEQCGWLKDEFGVSWQIVPRRMDEMLAVKDPARLARITEAFLSMKKFDLAGLERAAAPE